MKTWKEGAGAVAGLAIFCAALYFIHRELAAYHIRDILDELRRTADVKILAAIALTFLCYFILTFYDWLAVKFAGHRLRHGQVAFVSFLAHAFSNNIGLANLAGGTVRYRYYSYWGISAGDIARIVATQVSSTWVGFFAVAGAVFTIDPPRLVAGVDLPFSTARPIGLVLLGAVLLYGVLVVSRKRPLRIWRWHLPVPSPALFSRQLLISGLDWSLTGIALYVLLPSEHGFSYASFLGVYLLAQMAGILSHVPGGLGVFEGTMLLFLGGRLPSSRILGALLLYRAIYFFLPLALAVFAAGGFEVWVRREKLQSRRSAFELTVTELSSKLVAAGMLFGGAWILVSGSYAPLHEGILILRGCVGAALLLLAPLVSRGSSRIWKMAIAALGAGVALAVAAGPNLWETAYLLILLATVLVTPAGQGREFHPVVPVGVLPGVFGGLGVMILTIWISIFEHRHLGGLSELWARARGFRVSLVAAAAWVFFGAYGAFSRKTGAGHANSPDRNASA